MNLVTESIAPTVFAFGYLAELAGGVRVGDGEGGAGGDGGSVQREALPAPAVLVVGAAQVAQLAPAAWLRRRTWVKATVAWAVVRAMLVSPMVMGRLPVAVQVGVPR